MIEPAAPLDWIPEVFRNMIACDEHGVIWHIDWSVPGGRWVEKYPKQSGKTGEQHGK